MRVWGKNIILVGMMCTGKSTVGRSLAEYLNMRFIDVDHAIEAKAGRTIRDLFKDGGETCFRQLETRTLEEVLQGENQVVATGGGAVLAEANRECMRRSGLVIALTSPAEVIIQRAKGDGDRPLLQGHLEERVRRIMEERRDAYRFADVTIDSSSASVPDVVLMAASEWEKKHCGRGI